MESSSFEAVAEATSGALGGLVSTTILYPLDTCKTKYQAEVQAGHSRKYRSLLDVFTEAVSSGQILSLYQGLGTKSLQSVISQFIYFYSYSFSKNLYLKRSKKKKLDTSANLIVAAAAGACTAVLTQPLDTASARMQTSNFGKSKGLWETLTQGSWKQAFDGLGASLVLTSNPAIQYTVFEQFKAQLIQRQINLLNGSNRTMVGKQHGDGKPFPLVLSAFSAFMLGALSKTMATVATYPAIRCKVTIQAAEPEEDKIQGKNDSEKLKLPRTMDGAFRVIWQQEGVAGFYKGLHAQVLKTVLSAALMLMIKEKVSKVTWLLLFALKKWIGSANKRIKKA